jgi:hypothetical protein
MTLSIYADTPTALDPEEIASRTGIAAGKLGVRTHRKRPA